MSAASAVPQLASPKRSVLVTIGTLAKFFLNVYSTTHIFDLHNLLTPLQESRNRPVITLCNHDSVLDDPMLWGVLPYSMLMDRSRMRWSLGAKEICFTNWLTSWFFASGRVIPTVRGDGIYQPALNLALEKLNENGWVHIFSEGKVNQERDMLAFRWGIARLIMETKVPPLVIPFWHKGLETVMPEDTKHYYPRPRKEIVIGYGQALDFATNGVLESVKDLDAAQARIKICEYLFRETVQVQQRTEQRVGEPGWRDRRRTPKNSVDVDPPRKWDPS
ncbi:acyltransferase-domain-containing protein [Phlyctochytrium arcticum]|nr:acyltransferase-domain-containing protein [Phlyctochytrium arcticum]